MGQQQMATYISFDYSTGIRDRLGQSIRYRLLCCDRTRGYFGHGVPRIEIATLFLV